MAQIFPQADDLDKIIKIISLNNSKINTDYLKVYLNLGTDRQISYYLSACKFLDILDANNEFTEFGRSLKLHSEGTMFHLLSKKIVSKSVFGEVFFMSLKSKEVLNRDEVSQLILTLTDIENHSVAYRRSQTVISWLSRIFNEYKIGIHK